MTYAELAIAVMDWPWAVRFGIGHVLPLLVALYCLFSLRRFARTTAIIPFLAAMFANGYLLWITAKLVKTPVPGGILLSVAMTPAVSVMLALVIATTAATRIGWRAVFATTFFPLYIVDIICGQKVFGALDTTLAAVGGAGPLDALVLIPALSVLMAWGAGRDKNIFKRFLRPV
jgi:hypothetical protein